MAIFSTRDKQAMILAIPPVIAVVLIVGALITFWYITVPIAVALIGVYLWRLKVALGRDAALRKGSVYVEAHTHVPRPGQIDWAAREEEESGDTTKTPPTS
jgi:hypothetical protein